MEPTAEDYLKNEKWLKLMDTVFTQVDTNKNGYVSTEDYYLIINKMEKIVTDRPELIAKAREVTTEICDGLGLKEGVKADEKMFVEMMAGVAASEVAAKKKGEESLFVKYYNAIFDIVDHNHDGCVTLEEYKIVTEAMDHAPDVAEATFNMLDKNKNGKIERSEFISMSTKFWCELDSPDTKGMFGGRYE